VSALCGSIAHALSNTSSASTGFPRRLLFQKEKDE
jgi:hypothetical protein